MRACQVGEGGEGGRRVAHKEGREGNRPAGAGQGIILKGEKGGGSKKRENLGEDRQVRKRERKTCRESRGRMRGGEGERYAHPVAVALLPSKKKKRRVSLLWGWSNHVVLYCRPGKRSGVRVCRVRVSSG